MAVCELRLSGSNRLLRWLHGDPLRCTATADILKTSTTAPVLTRSLTHSLIANGGFLGNMNILTISAVVAVASLVAYCANESMKK